MNRKAPDMVTWQHGCDACKAIGKVEYAQSLGYLCAACRQPGALAELRRALRQSWKKRVAK